MDPAHTVAYKGQTIGFCCPNCPPKFTAEPTKFLAKVPEFKDPDAKPTAATKPINDKCARDQKDVDPKLSVTYKGQLIGLCSADCKAKFEADPAKYIQRVKEFKEPAAPKPEEKKPEPKADAKPINKKCPLMPEEDIDAKVTFTYKNQVIAFCCKDCCKEFAKEPEKHVGKVKEFKKP